MSQILLVEDNKEIYQMVAQTIAPVGKLSWSKNLEEAKGELTSQPFDLILLDIELPDGNGIEFCNTLQGSHALTPIFLLTSHLDLSEKVLGFSAGADDYITKPFSVLELRARVESSLKKSRIRFGLSDIYKWKEIQIYKSRQEVCILEDNEYKKIDLTSLEFKILLYFAVHAGEVIVRDDILNSVWGEDIHVYHRSVDTHVSKLRKKLGGCSNIVESIHGSGYKFNPTPL